MDTSLIVYADDLNKKLVVGKCEASLVKQKMGISSRRLDTELIKDGFVQNKGKQVSMLVMVGRGCQEERRLLKEGWGEEDGVLTECGRYLGPQIHSRLHSTPGLEKRVLLTRQAFFSMGKFWFCPGLPLGSDRLHLQGAEHYVVGHGDLHLDTRRGGEA